MGSKRRQVAELIARNASLESEAKNLRRDLDLAQQERADWQRRCERLADDVGNAQAAAAVAAVRDPDLADALTALDELRTTHARTVEERDEAIRETADIRALHRQRRFDRAMEPAVDPGVVARLERQVREGQARELALQARLELLQQIPARRTALGVAR